jgi:PKD repeat protein
LVNIDNPYNCTNDISYYNALINTESWNQPFSYRWFIDGQNSGTQNYATQEFTEIGEHFVQVEATLNNGCIAKKDTLIQVYAKPYIDFELPKACQNNPGVFLNKSEDLSGNLDYIWRIDDRLFIEEHPEYSFKDTGDYIIRLEGVNSFNCRDISEQNLYVNLSPKAEFSFDYQEEPYPDWVVFENLSDEIAKSYLWDFGDGNTSDEAAPQHLYSAEGDYIITLTAQTELGCEHIKSLPITYSFPDYDLVLWWVEKEIKDQYLYATVYLANESNRKIQHMRMLIQTDQISQYEDLPHILNPGETVQYKLNWHPKITSNYAYLCFELVSDYPELETKLLNNKYCEHLAHKAFIIQAAPIPANNSIVLDYYTPKAASITISISDVLGAEVWRNAQTMNIGNHSREIFTDNLASGVYIIRLLVDNQLVDKKKITVAH